MPEPHKNIKYLEAISSQYLMMLCSSCFRFPEEDSDKIELDILLKDLFKRLTFSSRKRYKIKCYGYSNLFQTISKFETRFEVILVICFLLACIHLRH